MLPLTHDPECGTSKFTVLGGQVGVTSGSPDFEESDVFFIVSSCFS